MEAKLVMIVGEGRIEFVRPMDPTPIDNHDDLFPGVAEAGHHLVDILAQLLGIKVRDNFIDPTFKGSECPYRIFGLRALYTTRGRGLEHHRPAGDGVGHPRAARPLGHLSIIGPGLLV